MVQIHRLPLSADLLHLANRSGTDAATACHAQPSQLSA